MIDLKELSGYPFFPFAAPYSISMEALGARSASLGRTLQTGVGGKRTKAHHPVTLSLSEMFRPSVPKVEHSPASMS